MEGFGSKINERKFEMKRKLLTFLIIISCILITIMSISQSQVANTISKGSFVSLEEEIIKLPFVTSVSNEAGKLQVTHLFFYTVEYYLSPPLENNILMSALKSNDFTLV